MPKGCVSSSRMKVPMNANGGAKIFNVKEDIIDNNITPDYKVEYTYGDILEFPQLQIDGSPFEVEIKYPEDIMSGKGGIFNRIINDGILANFKIHETRLKSFTVRVFPPNSKANFETSYLKCLNGGYFIYLFPYAKNDLNDMEKLLMNDLNDKVKDVDKIPASECFNFTTKQGSYSFEDNILIQKNRLYFIPFGFSQVIGYNFDNEKVTVIPSTKPGGRPITINKFPSQRIIAIIQMNLTASGLCKALSSIADIQEKVGLVSGGANHRRNRIVSDIGSKLILKKDKEDYDILEDDDISMMDVSKSIVRLIKGNKMILGLLTKAIVNTLGKSHPDIARTAINGINEISKIESIDEAISKMKELLLSNEHIATILINFMGGEDAQNAKKEIEVYDD